MSAERKLGGRGFVDRTQPHQTQCLHCMVWDAINAHAPVWPDEPGKKQYDPSVIIGNLVDVIAEIVAGDDRNGRRQWFGVIEEHLRKRVAQNIADGNFPAGKMVAIQ